MRNRLVSLGRRCVYHFTDSRNISLIKKAGGLCSLRKLTEQNPEGIFFGGNQWSHEADECKGVDEFIHLAFANDHPMAYRAQQEGRIENICWLTISLNILTEAVVVFTNDVSNKSGVPLLSNDEAREAIDLEGLFDHLDFTIEKNKIRKNNARKSEILVKDFIPLSYILNIDSY